MVAAQLLRDYFHGLLQILLPGTFILFMKGFAAKVLHLSLSELLLNDALGDEFGGCLSMSPVDVCLLLSAEASLFCLSAAFFLRHSSTV